VHYERDKEVVLLMPTIQLASTDRQVQPLSLLDQRNWIPKEPTPSEELLFRAAQAALESLFFSETFLQLQRAISGAENSYESVWLAPAFTTDVRYEFIGELKPLPYNSENE
jgi:hypothetical protein